MEYYDFIAIPPTIWRKFKNWYRADWDISRYLRREKNKWVLAVYP